MRATPSVLLALPAALLLSVPGPALAQATVTVVDSAGAVGYTPSIAIGTDGLGLIAYYDATNRDLKVAHCQNAACTSATVSTIDSAGDVGREAAIAIGTDGRGIISYEDETLHTLKAAHCNDVACTSATVTVVDPAVTYPISLQGQTSVAIGSDGLPLIVYVRGNFFDSQLAAAHCSDTACSASTVSLLGPVVAAGNMDTAVAIGSDGLGLIAYPSRYIFSGVASISMAHCVDVACTAVTPAGPVAPLDEAPQGTVSSLERTSLLMGSDGRGLVSYRRFLGTSTGALYEIVVQHCASTACESFDSTRVIPVEPNEGPNAPLAMGAGGLPQLTLARQYKLRIAQCGDAACATSTDSCVYASGGDTAMARGADGLPLVAFLALGVLDLRVAHGSDSCVSVAGVQDLEVDEGNAPMLLPFYVTLNMPTDQTATVHFETADVTAQAGTDYEAVSGTLTFPPGWQGQIVWLTILGDTHYETNETFQIVLSDPQGVTVGDGLAVVTLRNDDSLPGVSVQAASVVEGDSGLVEIQFEARLSGASGLPATVDYATTSGTAQAGLDFLAASGTLSFAPGTTTQTVSVSVVGDTTVELDETFFLNLSNPMNATIDGPGQGLIVDDDAPSLSSLELGHGSRVRGDLEAAPGPLADADFFRLAQAPYTSWEVVVDEVSGDIAPGLLLERLAEDNSTVLQTGVAVGTGSARAVRWQHRASTTEVRHHIRVSSTSCTTDCGADDEYRLRVFETTGSIPRFNNSGYQVTVLILQNVTDRAIQANADFWDASGVRRATVGIPLDPQGVAVVNTFSIPGLAGLTGSITVTHDGGYGAVAGKAVALEPDTGFSFDSPMTVRPR